MSKLIKKYQKAGAILPSGQVVPVTMENGEQTINYPTLPGVEITGDRLPYYTNQFGTTYWQPTVNLPSQEELDQMNQMKQYNLTYQPQTNPYIGLVGDLVGDAVTSAALASSGVGVPASIAKTMKWVKRGRDFLKNTKKGKNIVKWGGAGLTGASAIEVGKAVKDFMEAEQPYIDEPIVVPNTISTQDNTTVAPVRLATEGDDTIPILEFEL